jgi:hypothetical protein
MTREGWDDRGRYSFRWNDEEISVYFTTMIDKIGYTRPPLAARVEVKRRSAEAGGTSFSDLLDDAAGVGDADAANPVAATVSVGLLGLQEVSEEEIQRQRAMKQGRATLDALEQLRDGMLTGTLPLVTLQKLERLVAEERATVMDPRLSAILDEIEVRAAVELAKLEQARGK